MAEIDIINTAEAVCRDMTDLLAYPPFQRLQESLRKSCDVLANEVLHESMPPERREELRQFRLGMLTALRRPAEDLEAQKGVLAERGITFSDVLRDGGGQGLLQED